MALELADGTLEEALAIQHLQHTQHAHHAQPLASQRAQPAPRLRRGQAIGAKIVEPELAVRWLSEAFAA